MPVIVRDLDDDAATIIMVDSNLQRESLLPSERAFAYKMKLEAKLLFFHIIQQYINLFAAIVVAIFIAWKKELVYRDVKQGSNEIKFVKLRFIQIIQLLYQLFALIVVDIFNA